MKNYLLSFLYCLVYLVIFLLSFWGLSVVLDARTHQIVLITSLLFGFGMSFFLTIWFHQSELFNTLLLSLFTYLLVLFFRPTTFDSSSFFYLILYPLICWLFPINVYIIAHFSSSDSFIYPFSKKLLILGSEISVLYLLVYFIPVLFGPEFLIAFQQQISNLLYFPSSLLFPTISIFIFAIFFLLLLPLKNRMEQIQAALITLFSMTFLSLYFVQSSTLFNLCFVSAVASVLFSLLQVSHKMAFLDELTNVPARRALFNELKRLEGENYTLAMIDIDFFKRLNDTYGHDVGDQALRMISATLSQHSHQGTLYRYGGEEFVLLFPNKQIDEVLDEMEETRVLVSNSDFFLRPKSKQENANQPYLASVRITLSFGVAQKMENQTYNEVLNVADRALYKAKQTGRNKTVYDKNGKFFELF